MADSPLKVLKANRSLLSVCVLVATAQLTWGTIVPILPAYAAELNVDETQVGLIVGAFGLGRLISNVPGGMVAERFSARRVMIVSTVWVVAATALCGLATSFSFLVTARVLTGIGAGVVMTAGSLWIVDATAPSVRASAVAMMQGFVLASSTLGPTLGGLTASWFGLTAPFFISGAVLLSALVWSLARRRLPPATHVETQARARTPSNLRHNTGFLAACAVSFALFFARFGATQTLVPLLAYHRYGWTVGTLGVILGVTAAANMGSVLSLGGLSDRIGRLRVATGSLLCSVPLALAVGTTNSGVLFAITGIAFSAVMAVANPIPVAFIADVVASDHRGRAIGISRTVGDVAAVIAPITIAWVLGRFGSLAAASTIGAVNVVAVMSFRRRTPRHADEVLTRSSLDSHRAH